MSKPVDEVAELTRQLRELDARCVRMLELHDTAPSREEANGYWAEYMAAADSWVLTNERRRRLLGLGDGHVMSEEG